MPQTTPTQVSSPPSQEQEISVSVSEREQPKLKTNRTKSPRPEPHHQSPQPIAATKKETDEFIGFLLQQLQERSLLKAGPAKFEIKVGNETAYRHISGGVEKQQPEINKLDSQTLAYLAEAIKQPAVDPGQVAQPNSILDRDVTIKVNEQVVFRLEQGIVEINKLDPELAKEISKVAQQVSVAVEPEKQAVTEALKVEEQEAPNTKQKEVQQEVNNTAVFLTAQKILQMVGSNHFENLQYSIQKQGDNLTINSKDGRGEILSSKDGKVNGNLQSSDIFTLHKIEQNLSQELVNQSRTVTQDFEADDDGVTFY